MRDRLEEYLHMGARFAKWRAAIAVNNHLLDNRLPIRGCLNQLS